MNQELRIYGTGPGRLADWEKLFLQYVMPFHDEHGLKIRAAWRDDAKGQFVWIRDVGTSEEVAQFTAKLCTPDFLANCADIGVTVLDARVLQDVVAPRF